ncbi:CHAT domain-containing tetratricopeptide repeat protein [Allomuricauda taeanensis]|uniref:CHAT domain-containing protein n=1 Tax=Flagellimonas taeanensis TaxID=1005926 RepID=UPI002E7B1079|nr:CHAT domain-containing tetratricopeptide repeat protein [Allomuricauda taeanensis]MEE1963982.1 CHAT domain-containing tetratricopeptide repeat protein [Allomuricauda taeanensis]
MFKGLSPFLLMFALLLQASIFSQQHPALKKLDSLISIDAFQEAQALIVQEIGKDPKNTQLNLGKLVYLLAKTEFLQDRRTSFPKAQKLLKDLESGHQPDSVRFDALMGMGLAQIDKGNVIQANETVLRANTIAAAMQDPERKLTSEYYLGEIGLKLGDFDQLMDRTEKALRVMNDHPKSKFRLAPRVLNYKASLMHFMGKPDSVNYYFEKAIQSIDKTDEDPEYQYYLPSVIYGNWTLAKQTAGDYEAAMEFTLKCISSYNTFLQKTHNHPLTEKVQGNLSIAYRNLGSLYNDLGDKEKAIQVATLGYHHAKKYFLPNTVQYFSAVLMMGEAFLYGENPEKARKYLEEAKASLQTIPGDNWLYAANLYSVLGDLEKKDGGISQAIAYYQKTLEAYENSSPDEFSQNVVYAQFNLAQSFADDHQFNTAENLIDETYTETAKIYGTESFLAKTALLTKIRISYLEGDFEKTVQLCEQLLPSQENETEGQERLYQWGDRAEILLYLAKSKFQLLPHSLKNLQDIAQTLDRATDFVEKRKSLVSSQNGVANLIENNREIFNFAKKVYLELYQQTHDERYLEKVMTLNESSIYNRIRARLNLANNGFSPVEIREKENRLREQIDEFFNLGEDQTQFNAAKWDSLSTAWQEHLSLLQKEYPEYYKMRYASILQPLKNLKQQVPANTTLVRYFSDGDKAYAYVYHDGMTKLTQLGNLKNLCTSSISDYSVPENELFECLHQLFKILWKPIEEQVKTENVIIFPDGELFNLSFELLTPQKISSLKQLATNSLLAKHNISYNYSLFMLDQQQKVLEFENNFIAFVPEFDEQMKSEYVMAIMDSLYLDKTYLTLLPQPFSYDLAEKFGKMFHGDTFLNEKASKQVFSKMAKEHKIIHIATHAESNNLSPELSRLVFAKNTSDLEDINDNYLYTYEIYDENLSSNLTILTACETGKPTYQPGEGMISLAHAFNYAGSESILTSLWQIDEKSSAQILASFYDYLSEGKRKDEAIRLAKLDYLSQSEGRTLHPQYWAGLILMGNTAPIDLHRPMHWTIWATPLIVVLILALAFFRKRKTPAKTGANSNN